MSSHSRVVALLVVLVFVLGTLGCDGGTRVEGHVRDKGGTYLSDVSVTLFVGERSRTVRTDVDGRYRISMLHSPFNVKEKMRFEKPGYLEHKITFMSHDGVHELEVTLLRTVSLQN
jgi:hypothetical protein